MYTCEIWTEKYRPKLFSEMIGENSAKLEKLCKSKKTMPHLLFTGNAGTGKTTAAYIVAREIGGTVKVFNASDDNSVEYIRTSVKDFVSHMGLNKGMKIVILDESDNLSSAAQATLRRMIEEFTGRVLFIATANYPHKLIDPLKDRFYHLEFKGASKKEIYKYVKKILNTEGVEYEDKAVKQVILDNPISIRNIIKELQSLSSINDNKITEECLVNGVDYINDIYQFLKNSETTKAREIVIKKDLEPIDVAKRLFYLMLDNESKEEKKDIIAFEVANFMNYIRQSADREISLYGLFSTLSNVVSKK